MDKKIKQAFKKDIESLTKNNLNYEQIKNKIEINEDNKINYIKKYSYFRNHWKLITTFASIFLVFTISLAYHCTYIRKQNYNLSPYSEELSGTSFGMELKEIYYIKNNLSNFLDMQHNELVPHYFYEVNLVSADDYYTCAYFPSKNYDEVLKKANHISLIYNYTSLMHIIDGKYISAYYKLYDTNVKWYQIPKNEEIPELIEEYQLGLVLSSRDVFFIENKTTKFQMNFTKKIFIREHYNINEKRIEEDYSFKRNFLKYNDKALMTSRINYIDDESIYGQPFFLVNEIKNNALVFREDKDPYTDFIGHYEEQLNEIKLAEYEDNMFIYFEYDYQEFCKMFFNDR